jgi:hypothetical protein
LFYNLIFIFIPIFIIGCEKPNPNPQDSDPIYQDIKSKISNIESRKVKADGILKELEGFYSDAEPHSSQPKYFRAKIQDTKLSIEKLDQELRFEKMRLENRESYVKKKYLISFSHGEKWKNTEEVEAYKKAEKWSRAVASVHRNTKRSQEKTEVKKESGSEEKHSGHD